MMTGIPRRSLLAGGVAIGALTLASGALTGIPVARASDALRQRWCDILTGGPALDLSIPAVRAAVDDLDGKVERYRTTLVREDGRTRVFGDLALDPKSDSAAVTRTFVQLRDMAVAWRTPGSRFHNDQAVLTDTLEGLATARYIAYRPVYVAWKNWWDREIGSSIPLADCLVLLHDQMPGDTRAWYVDALRYFVADPWYFLLGNSRKLSTGANRVDLCRAVMIEGIASDNADRIARAASGLPITCAYVAEGDGFGADGSFIQHQVHPYTGGYGTTLLSGLSKLIPLMAGTEWELDLSGPTGNLFDSVERTFAPVIHDGRMMSYVRGRAVSRADAGEHSNTSTAIHAILDLSKTSGLDEATVNRWRSICRGWIERAKAYDFAATTDLGRIAAIAQLINSDTAAEPEPDGSVIFTRAARSAHRRDGWALAVSMASDRIARYECINNENLKGFHTGAGMSYLYDGDNAQFTDAFWATVDPYRLPGTTVDSTPLADAAGQTTTTDFAWAGGPVLDGYSAPGMMLQSAETNLVGRKSWFCLDEYVIAVGSGITGGAGQPVSTVIENRNLHETGANTLLINGEEWLADLDEADARSDATWAHLDGVAGYLIGSGQRLLGERKERTGSWRDIRANGDPTPIDRRYLSLVLDHGTDPTAAGYRYVVVPGASATRTAELAANPDHAVLADDENCHAVRQPDTGITMINLWHAPRTVGGIHANKECGIIMIEKNDRLRIAVANPMRDGAVIRIRISPSETGYQLVEADPGITPVSVERAIVLDVVSGTTGASLTATFRR